jgi:hypothetical protein
VELREAPEFNDAAPVRAGSHNENDPVSVYQREIGTLLPPRAMSPC